MSLNEPMNWESLPWFIIEKIAYHTAEAPVLWVTPDSNQWLMGIRDCAAVCESWRAAILASDKICKESVIHFGDDVRADGDALTTNDTAELLVKEGYMRFATHLDLIAGEFDTDYVLNLLLEYGEGNTIAGFKVCPMEWETENFNAFVRLLKMSTPRCIEVLYGIDNQQKALMFWSLLIDIIRSDGNCIELIEFDLHGAEFDENINWQFVVDHVIANHPSAPVRKVGTIRLCFYDKFQYDETTAPSVLCFQYADLCADNLADFVNKCQGMLAVNFSSELIFF